jgi:hypothetical protein
MSRSTAASSPVLASFRKPMPRSPAKLSSMSSAVKKALN